MSITNTFCRHMVSLLTGTLLAFAATGATAADRSTGEPDRWMTDRYEVEIIVFRHRDQSRNTPEQPAPGEIDYPALGLYPSAPSAPPAPYLGPYADGVAADPRESERSPAARFPFYLLELDPQFPDFVPLTNEQLQLGDVIERLTLLDAYEPLVHQAWVQAANPADTTIPINIDSTANGDYAVTGTIRLYKERYAHLAIDLNLRQALPDDEKSAAESNDWPVFGDVFPPAESEPVPLQIADGPTYQLQESRRIRGSNAQYFDHPQFGVIARINEVDLEED